MSLIQNFKKFFNRVLYASYRLQQNLDDLKVLHGKMLSQQNKNNFEACIIDIRKAEFKVFSQWGDDGIIEFLVSYLDIPSKTFIEFGVEDYTESNTRFLLINRNWSGLVMDGSKKNIDYIQKDNIYWQHELTAKQVFVTKENINKEIVDSGFSGELGILHVDIDGNDYWIWKEIDSVNPVIIIVEYNSVFGKDRAITVPYDPSFVRNEKHYSDLFFGASIKAFVTLGQSKGYSFIGCNTAGNNAYFVRNDKMKELKSLTVEEGYVISKFRECRDQQRNLAYVSGSKRIEVLKGLQVVNVETGATETL
ncbi:MAG: hypothetical protein HQ491_11245 [Bacteroidetes bacterium]|nr:hypothetical protein [Bacteroidota bacterium]